MSVLTLTIVFLALVAWPVAAIAADDADKKGDLTINLRYRFEDVSDDAVAKDGHASTLRTTLGYRSASWKDFSGFVEVEDVLDLFLDDQHANGGAGSLSNGVSDRPVIADPDSTEFNQAYLRYAGWTDTTIDVGRQGIALGQQRFVGPVGWRQNHQSFDALRIQQSSIPRTKLNYAFVTNTNQPNGGNQGTASHLFNAEVSVASAGRLIPYAYLLDYDADSNAGLSTSTYGLRWEGNFDVGEEWSLPIVAELAEQSDAGDNPGEVDAGYHRFEIGASDGKWTVKVGQELLEGDATDGRFATPLATLHKFNGWADKFLMTPATGLEDSYAEVGRKHGSLAWKAIYHDFKSDSDGIDYGTEIDAVLTYKASWKQVFALTYAMYDADELFEDTEKLWFWTSCQF